MFSPLFLAQLVAPGTLCRPQARQCDLPEFCTGKSPHCPTNFYQMDGTSCEGGQAYCYNGMCLTYQAQCEQLWGPGKWAGSALVPPTSAERGILASTQHLQMLPSGQGRLLGRDSVFLPVPRCCQFSERVNG